MKRDRVPEQEAAFVLYNILLGLEYLHQKDIIHRDLKLENILIGNDNTIKLCDFGWCSEPGDLNRRIVCGTYEYMAPEVVRQEFYDCKIDIWSLGVIAFELVHKYSPFKAPDRTKVFQNILAGKYYVDSSISEEYTDFISKCLDPFPFNRWTAKRLLGHRLFSELKKAIDSRKPIGDGIPSIAHNYELELESSALYHRFGNRDLLLQSNLPNKPAILQSQYNIEHSMISNLGASMLNISPAPNTEHMPNIQDLMHTNEANADPLNMTQNHRAEETTQKLNLTSDIFEDLDFDLQQVPGLFIDFLAHWYKGLEGILQSDLNVANTEVNLREPRPRKTSQASQKETKIDHRVTLSSEPCSNTPSLNSSNAPEKDLKTSPRTNFPKLVYIKKALPDQFEIPYDTSLNPSRRAPEIQPAEKEKGIMDAILELFGFGGPENPSPENPDLKRPPESPQSK